MCLYGPGSRKRRLDAICCRGEGSRFPGRSQRHAELAVRASYAETAAWAKVLVDKQSDRIVGAGYGIKDLVDGFPTFSADIKSML